MRSLLLAGVRRSKRGDDPDLGVELGEPGLVPRLDGVDEVDDDRAPC